ncbi:CHAD domain-containing protein [Paraburkholderia sp. GAS32]|uniref:CHAD domain-containing protein n=1 Tax=Paraburkholderia sp. GAS32 TaxID=3035129 RepID=UPI003D25F796
MLKVGHGLAQFLFHVAVFEGVAEMSSRYSASAKEESDAPASGSGQDGPCADSITAATSAAEAFVVLATSTSAEAVRRAHTLRAKADPEVLHKLRVALRRLRSLWWAYEPLLDRKDARLQREEFKYLAYAAGRTRDWDVLRDILTGDQLARLSLGPLLHAVGEHRADALSFSRRTIRSAGVEEILQRAMTGARQQLDSHVASLTLAEFAQERVELAEKALKKRVKRAIQPEHPGYAALHEVRIAGKKLRYLLELFSPALDGSHQANLELLTAVQDELGKLNDLVVSETLLRQYSFQLGDPNVVKEAVVFLGAQKKRHMRAAHKMLRNVW